MSPLRLLAAGLVALAYLGMCAWFLRPLWRRKANATDTNANATLIAYASQTGFAEQLAERTASSLKSAGMSVRLAPAGEVRADTLASVQQALFIVSTTGEGDAPDPAVNFVNDVLDDAVPLDFLRYGVLALGDRKYRNFCAFGHRVDTWLRHQGATALFDVVEVDDGDEGALRNWQHQLSVLSESPDLPDWETPRYDRWRLTHREQVNPGSAGDPCFHLVLAPENTGTANWQAGDIAEIDPDNSTWNSQAPALPHREYSIASVPEDGTLHLLVRQMRRPDGTQGLGSGWLTERAALDSHIALRIRKNSNFHLPDAPRPLILIGNGTGIAGLRALLKARVAAGHTANWLIFGERNERHDFFFKDDLQRWHAQGNLPRLDLVFSRDQPQRTYVQHRLMERGEDLRAWIHEGAAIYVCGSLKGMAPGVDAALTHILGADLLEELAAAGRYRRDVY